eukprot:CAMPEP_0169467326 /NCGR_PEP_ID=MMETSP1042-20121227/22280_1 /TAXON_ID=464988 /ORGANISM="Hemiselmis andersenii, Strain CCMP1180" /LENGTH=65 /DNA_ID=CAMNT_0009580515 /DNA_START=250 /DNA_END=443 /DNA_ORIENTATION=-
MGCRNGMSGATPPSSCSQGARTWSSPPGVPITASSRVSTTPTAQCRRTATPIAARLSGTLARGAS